MILVLFHAPYWCSPTQCKAHIHVAFHPTEGMKKKERRDMCSPMNIFYYRKKNTISFILERIKYGRRRYTHGTVGRCMIPKRSVKIDTKISTNIRNTSSISNISKISDICRSGGRGHCRRSHWDSTPPSLDKKKSIVLDTDAAPQRNRYKRVPRKSRPLGNMNTDGINIAKGPYFTGYPLYM